MDEPIVIVSGLPRSGTSMMMQMLEAGGLTVLTDHVRQPDEDNPRGYYEYERVKALPADVGWLPEARGKVVKMVYRLLYQLPAGYQYRVVFMRRKLEEVIESQDEMLQRHGKTSTDMSDEQLRDIYQRQLKDAQAWIASRPNFDVIYIDYRDVLDDAAGVVGALDDFLGGSLDTEAMLRVPDPTLYRQRV